VVSNVVVVVSASDSELLDVEGDSASPEVPVPVSEPPLRASVVVDAFAELTLLASEVVVVDEAAVATEPLSLPPRVAKKAKSPITSAVAPIMIHQRRLDGGGRLAPSSAARL
jgi:hypothetical protein